VLPANARANAASLIFLAMVFMVDFSLNGFWAMKAQAGRGGKQIFRCYPGGHGCSMRKILPKSALTPGGSGIASPPSFLAN